MPSPPPKKIPCRVFIHCGWVVIADRRLDSEYENGDRETLRIFDDHREICIGSMKFKPFDGQPASSMLSRYPPAEFAGVRVEHHNNGLHAAGVQMESLNDEDGTTSWVLFSALADDVSSTLLRCTITVAKPEHREWALEVWKSIFYYGKDERKLQKELAARGLVR